MSVSISESRGETCAAGCRRHAARGPLLAVAGWLTAAVAALAVAAVPLDPGEALCGVWGCFPPLPALAAMHLFWCAAFGAGVHAAAGLRRGLLRPLGVALVFGAAVAGALVIGRDLTRWLEFADEHRHYWPRRVGYTLAVNTDLPLIQALAAGVACLVLAARRGRSCSTPPVY
jgi:hypothetical protein